MSRDQKIVQIENSFLKLRVCPEVGASITEFSLKKNDRCLEIMRRAEEPLERSSHGNFIMLPYSNRIKDAAFTWKGETYQLENQEKHAIHGDVRDRPWTVTSQSGQQIVLEIESQDFPDFNFPFPISAKCVYKLSENQLSITLAVTNKSESAIPLGFGLHPYFNTRLGGENDSARVRFSAQGYYPYQGETPLPEGPPVSIPEDFCYDSLEDIRTGIDHCYSGWNGKALIAWPQSKVELRIQCEEIYSHAIFFTPPDKDFFAFEPATMCTDGFNALEHGQQDTGVQSIDAGETLTAECSLFVSDASVSP